MPKLSLSTIASGYASVDALNANFDAIEAAIENTLSRDGTSPNTMSANLDMNSNRILNLPAPLNANEPARHGDLQTYVDDAEAAAIAAAASAVSAEIEADNAAASAIAAAASASAADASAIAADASADAAAASALDAAADADKIPDPTLADALKTLRVNSGGTAYELTHVSAGDVNGPTSATDNAVALFDGTTGKLIKNSTIVFTATGESLVEAADAAGARAVLDVYSESEVDGLLAAVASVPTGAMLSFMGTSVPSGYLACDGANVSRTTYAALFTAIGTTHGVGDGSTTFTLPDTRRRVAVGSGGSGTGTLGNAVGNKGGAETHTLSVAEIPSHNHPGSTTDSQGNHSHTIAIQQAGEAYSSGGNPNPYVAGGSSGTNTTGTHAHNVSVASQGSGGAHNNMQPSIVVLHIIKT